jgi:NitT/TauT family transport system ATP-binding protein
MSIHTKRSPAIEFCAVGRRFLTPEGKAVTALRDFTMTVERGEFVAIVGPAGCGKSSVLNLVAGLIAPSSGTVQRFGEAARGIDPRVGLVFQADVLFPWRSVIDNVVAGPLFRGVDKALAYASARSWLERVNLTGHETRYPHQLSDGMRKRVALAQTFINAPELLLMDEPFSALDAQTRTLMHDELLRLWSDAKASVLFVTHDLEEAIALADKVYVLTAGPATVKAVHRIDIPRPRRMAAIRYDQHFMDISQTIWDELRDEVMIGAARAELPV